MLVLLEESASLEVAKAMNSMFGPLKKYDDRAWTAMTKCLFFGFEFDVEVLIVGNDSDSKIYEEQFMAMAYFKQNEGAILAAAENEVRTQAMRENGSFDPAMIELTGLVFPMVLEKGERVFGLLMECAWDVENGLAVKFDGTLVEIGAQDLLT